MMSHENQRRTAKQHPGATSVTGWLGIVLSTFGGAAVTLLGVIVGGFVTRRSEQRQWARDRQIDACATVVQESTRMQLALLERWKRRQRPDWTVWNQALAMLWLVGTHEVIAEAKAMDRLFWLSSIRIKGGQMSEDAWAADRDEMEAARLRFINAARRAIVTRSAVLSDVPVARPPLSEVRDLLGSEHAEHPGSVTRMQEADNDTS